MNYTLRLFIVAASATLLVHCSSASSRIPMANRSVLLGNEVLIAAGDKNGAHFDVRISSDPKDARHLVVCDIRVLFPRLSDSVYISFDGGQKWKHTLQNTVGSEAASDAFCTIDHSRQVLFAGTAFAKPRFADDIYARGSPANLGSQSADVFYRSENGGLTWEPYVELPLMDREEVLSVPLGHNTENIYVFGQGVARKQTHHYFRVMVSGNRGRTFNGPLDLLTQRHFPYYGPNSNGVPLPGGDALTVFGENVSDYFKNHQQFVWQWNAVRISPTSVPRIVGSIAGQTTGCLSSPFFSDQEAPVLARDADVASPFKGRLYFIYTQRKGIGCNVLLSYSDTDGRTWMAPRIIDDLPHYNSKFSYVATNPAIAVNGNGIVAVVWLDNRDGQNGMVVLPRLAFSMDGGTTFDSSVPLSTHGVGWVGGRRLVNVVQSSLSKGSPDSGYSSVGSLELSWSIGLSITPTQNDSFSAVWTSNEDGGSQLWHREISVFGKAGRNGQFAGLKDLSNVIGLTYQDAKIDWNTGSISLPICLSNLGNRDVLNPLKLHVSSLYSRFGPLDIQSDGLGNRDSAVVDESHLLRGGRLRKGASTCGSGITLHLHVDPSQITQAKLSGPLFHLDTIILGKLSER